MTIIRILSSMVSFGLINGSAWTITSSFSRCPDQRFLDVVHDHVCPLEGSRATDGNRHVNKRMGARWPDAEPPDFFRPPGPS